MSWRGASCWEPTSGPEGGGSEESGSGEGRARIAPRIDPGEIRPARQGLSVATAGARFTPRPDSTCRTLAASYSLVNGLARNATPSSSTPLWTTALRV